jgi:hypothetical protein
MTSARPLIACVLIAVAAGCAPTREQFLRSQDPGVPRLIARQPAASPALQQERIAAVTGHPTPASTSDAEPVLAPVAMGMPETSGASDETATAKVGPLTVAARWIGPARPLITGYDLIGRVNRFVVPYTRQTWLVEVSVRNDGQMPQRMRATDWELVAEPGHLRRMPLDLDYFKERWPTMAVRTEAMMLDQAMAIGHVIRTIWGDRTIEPGETVTGVLPFLAGPEAPQQARLTWLAAPDPLNLEFGEAR